MLRNPVRHWNMCRQLRKFEKLRVFADVIFPGIRPEKSPVNGRRIVSVDAKIGLNGYVVSVFSRLSLLSSWDVATGIGPSRPHQRQSVYRTVKRN